MKCIEERDDDDNHDDDDEGDDYDDNRHEDDKDYDCHDNYHRSILGVTNAADDCNNCHCSSLCITNAAKSGIKMIIHIITIRMTTVLISMVTASAEFPMLPSATFETYRRDDDNHDDRAEGDGCDDNHHEVTHRTRRTRMVMGIMTMMLMMILMRMNLWLYLCANHPSHAPPPF